MEKILLKNGKFVLANRIVSGDLLVIDGKIKKITENENPLYENGIDLNEILPKMSPLNPGYLTKKQTVFQKISAFVEKFKHIGDKL